MRREERLVALEGRWFWSVWRVPNDRCAKSELVIVSASATLSTSGRVLVGLHGLDVCLQFFDLFLVELVLVLQVLTAVLQGLQLLLQQQHLLHQQLTSRWHRPSLSLPFSFPAIIHRVLVYRGTDIIKVDGQKTSTVAAARNVLVDH